MNSRLLIASHPWKLRAGIAGAVVLFGLIFAAGWLASFGSGAQLALVALAAAAICALLVGAVAIRCTSCRLNLVAWAMSKKEAGTWLSWLLAAETCPRCGCRANPANGGA